MPDSAQSALASRRRGADPGRALGRPSPDQPRGECAQRLAPVAGGRQHREPRARRAEPAGDGEYVNDLPFLDSDLYKWLEAIGWTLADPELAEGTAAELRERLSTATDLLTRVQADDGYLDSHFQVRFPGERFVQLAHGHELYCAGHLIQAAVAVHRSTQRRTPADVARRFADLIVASFGTGEGRVDGVCGHPEIETALVELHRETGEQSYLDTAQYFIDRRGHGLLGHHPFGPQYFQDHVPVRDAQAVAGHSVRQLYLLAGVTDLAIDTGEDALREAATRLWAEGTATQTYLTGGIGAHHRDEAYGDPYELPNERSYCETCAAIASIMFSWRMLLMTGEAQIRRSAGTHALQRVPGRHLPGRRTLHLRQPAAGP